MASTGQRDSPKIKSTWLNQVTLLDHRFPPRAWSCNIVQAGRTAKHYNFSPLMFHGRSRGVVVLLEQGKPVEGMLRQQWARSARDDRAQRSIKTIICLSIESSCASVVGRKARNRVIVKLPYHTVTRCSIGVVWLWNLWRVTTVPPVSAWNCL